MIGIIDYGAGNTRSVQNALERIGVPYLLTDKKEELDTCEKIIFPGVGSAGATMKSLQEKNLVDWIQNCKKPFLGICVGMQLLFEKSEEGNTECLGVIPGRVQKFKATKKVPHMGWNKIECGNREICECGNGKYFYFVHSYYVPVNSVTTATCEYQDEFFSAIVQKGNFWGMQFHPEKSGDAGQKLLSNFLHNGNI